LFGVFWSWQPLRLVVAGETAEAKVAFVIEEKLGQEPIKHDTRRSVQAAEDPTRNATYFYHLRFVTSAGKTVTAPLNYGQVLRPILSIGDRVQIVYAPDDPSTIIDKWSIRTWAFGIFFTGIGMMIFLSQLFVYRAADRPIILDSIQDYADIVVKPTEKSPGVKGGSPSKGLPPAGRNP
jgi:hypothetical protein